MIRVEANSIASTISLTGIRSWDQNGRRHNSEARHTLRAYALCEVSSLDFAGNALTYPIHTSIFCMRSNVAGVR